MIEDHQDLLEKYYQAEMGVISEYSGNYEYDIAELSRVVTEYASRMGLESPASEH